MRSALNIVSGGMRSPFRQASAIASGVTRSIQAVLNPTDFAPIASHGFDETKRTSAGAIPRRASTNEYASGLGLKIRFESMLIVAWRILSKPVLQTTVVSISVPPFESIASL